MTEIKMRIITLELENGVRAALVYGVGFDTDAAIKRLENEHRSKLKKKGRAKLLLKPVELAVPPNVTVTK